MTIYVIVYIFEQETICSPLFEKKKCEKKFVDSGFVKTCDEFVTS